MQSIYNPIVIIDRKIKDDMCIIYKNAAINKNILFNIDKQIWKCYINHKKIVSGQQCERGDKGS